METSIPRSELLRLVYGEHDDPFSILGAHRVELYGREMIAIRVFVPDAEQVFVHRETREPLAMGLVHEAGFFEIFLEEADWTPGLYQVEVWYADGTSGIYYDPYSFGTILSSFDLYLIGEGSEDAVYRKFGAHPTTVGGIEGVYFAVWAPNARRVSLIGDFNQWQGRQNPMRKLLPSGVWEIFIPGLRPGARYKFEVVSPTGHVLAKADPFAFAAELRPACASIVTDLQTYRWGDGDWLTARRTRQHFQSPMAIYEVHLGSWQQNEDDDEVPFLNYRELAHRLVDYVTNLGYTHIEIMPVMEHLLDKSWGYQVIGYYAPTSRYGSPDDFKYFIDYCHKHDISVIMDWVPAHFPRDYTALARFDGTALYEHEDPRRGSHPQWGTYIFHYSRNEVRNFLICSALFWFREYHLDGIRVDAVASMLYLNFGREPGEWLPNDFGGQENLEAIDFIKEMNVRVHQEFPDVLMIAEESTSWPMVTRPVYVGGLGFDMKWNLGWMNDTLKYMRSDPIYRKFLHNILTWNIFYVFTENFLLPFSHDEVVHLKRAMLDKMPGDYWKKMANLRLCYAYQYGCPGKKLLFMGSEFGMWREWTELFELDWDLTTRPYHYKLLLYITDLNKLYRQEPSLWQLDFSGQGFQWIDFADADRSVIAFLRRGLDPDDFLIWILNFTPVPHHNYRIGVPRGGRYSELFNTDAERYGGSNMGNMGEVIAHDVPWHIFPASCELTLPPLAAIVLKPDPLQKESDGKKREAKDVDQKNDTKIETWHSSPKPDTPRKAAANNFPVVEESPPPV